MTIFFLCFKRGAASLFTSNSYLVSPDEVSMLLQHGKRSQSLAVQTKNLKVGMQYSWLHTHQQLRELVGR